MFTGIVEGLGKVRRLARRAGAVEMEIAAPARFRRFRLGESIAINGTCLTVTRARGCRFSVDVSPETLRRTTLGQLRVGALVNLERSLKVGDKLGGHLVFGHVDAIGTVHRITPEGESMLVRFKVPAGLSRYLVEKGSVAVDGVSLTVFDCRPGFFSVAIIPHTAEVTLFGRYRQGDRVNIETDMLARYVEKLIEAYLARLPGERRKKVAAG